MWDEGDLISLGHFRLVGLLMDLKRSLKDLSCKMDLLVLIVKAILSVVSPIAILQRNGGHEKKDHAIERE